MILCLIGENEPETVRCRCDGVASWGRPELVDPTNVLAYERIRSDTDERGTRVLQYNTELSFT